MPYIAYRGEHGPQEQVLMSRVGSLTFSTLEAAMGYALMPNNTKLDPVAQNPRIITAQLHLTNLIIDSAKDPFVEFADLAATVGTHNATQIALRHSAWIESTDHWAQTYANQHATVADLLASKPKALWDLYCQAYPIFDDSACVQLFLAHGFDGAIHAGNAQFNEHEEYRVFDRSRITILDIITAYPADVCHDRPRI